jgi:hypothetical protein
MQSKFLNVLDSIVSDTLIYNCAKSIEESILNNEDVVFLQYGNDEKTIDDLLKIPKSYYEIVKNTRDGSDCILPLINKDSTIKIIGIFFDECVYCTAFGLTKLINNRIEILYNSTSYFKEYDWTINKIKYLTKMGVNIHIVNPPQM